MHQCQICSSASVKIESDFFDYVNITSDCRPWPEGRAIATCAECHTTQRVLKEEAKEVYARVYQGYEMYKHAQGATDQVHFGTEGIPQARTEKILAFIEGKLGKQPNNVLDIGSGSGAGLVALANQFKQANVYGFEPNDRPEERQQALPENVKTIFTKRPEGKAEYDLVTLFHVLEHVEDTKDLLSYIASSLSEGGHILVQVPYPMKGPFDYVVADHIWHFSKQSLASLLTKAGYKVTYIGNELIEKELTMLATPSAGSAEATVEESDELDVSLNWLKAYKQFLDMTKAAHSELYVYGTGPSGAWAGQVLGENVVAYIDDDPKRIGSEFNGKPIIASKDADPSISVVAPFPDYQAEHIAKSNAHLCFLFPKSFRQTEAA